MDTGSSAISTLGRTASPRAMATRCRCPPESSCGNLAANWAGGLSATRRRSSSTAASRSPLAIWWIWRGRTRWWRTRCTGFNEANGSWKTICTCAAYARGRPGGAGRPSSSTSPPSGLMILASRRPTVVFPAPLSPTSAVTLPGSRRIETLSTA